MNSVESSQLTVHGSEISDLNPFSGSHPAPRTPHPTPVGLYIHIPYCASRCSYCDFNTYRFDADQAEQYLQGLAREIELYGSMEALRGRRIRTLFFGGGTPSILTASQLIRILDHCRTAFILDDGIEITMEANPGTVDTVKLRAIREGGVNRLSLGVQATQDGILQRIGRSHTTDQAEQAFWMAREAGFSNVNLDLMFGLPSQRLDDWAESLRRAVRLNPEHLSTYGLILEEGTRLHYESRTGRLELPDEETEAAMYHTAVEFLTGAGFEQYEISNFARRGFRCRHNLVYWEHGEYLGLGAGAHSFLDGRRFYNELLPANYVRSIWQRGTAVAGGEQLSPELLRSERLMLGLRMRDGMDLKTFSGTLGIEEVGACDRVVRFLDDGFLELKEGRVRLTGQGLLVANELIVQLF